MKDNKYNLYEISEETKHGTYSSFCLAYGWQSLEDILDKYLEINNRSGTSINKSILNVYPVEIDIEYNERFTNIMLNYLLVDDCREEI